MANPPDVQRTSPDSSGLENQVRETTPHGALETQDVPGGSVEGHGSVDIRSDRRRYTDAEIAEIHKGSREYVLRRRITSLSFLDSPLTLDPNQPSDPTSPPRYRRFTDAERRKLQEYTTEYSSFIGPDYWKLPPIDNAQGSPETDENTEQRNES
ncbi:hypothetical protein PILCRDRAFT_86496 [Piloderma croceum F 1598]|uniref:Uncharacterized protein n=1 Tax=Piloderma croceum (strain F 1598) TaxID=765440 RepID=A0A0C3FQ43_PILCF|nr:hypothetical protein PILCRDRAFT_86496 [Piloderma croceum F 1598]